jgi:hypothetical protein
MNMKSIKFIAIAVFAIVCINTNAQLFVGGNFGFYTSGGSIDNGTTSVDKPSTLGFGLSPMVGTFISDDIAIGAKLNLAFQKRKTPGTPDDQIDRATTIGLTPFVRYYAFKMDKFSIFGEGNIGFSRSTSSTKTGSITVDGPTTTIFNFGVFPGLAYDMSDKLSLETSINIFNFGYNIEKAENNGTKDKSSSFGFGAGLNNIVTLGSITIGAIYKF